MDSGNSVQLITEMGMVGGALGTIVHYGELSQFEAEGYLYSQLHYAEKIMAEMGQTLPADFGRTNIFLDGYFKGNYASELSANTAFVQVDNLSTVSGSTNAEFRGLLAGIGENGIASYLNGSTELTGNYKLIGIGVDSPIVPKNLFVFEHVPSSEIFYIKVGSMETALEEVGSLVALKKAGIPVADITTFSLAQTPEGAMANMTISVAKSVGDDFIQLGEALDSNFLSAEARLVMERNFSNILSAMETAEKSERIWLSDIITERLDNMLVDKNGNIILIDGMVHKSTGNLVVDSNGLISSTDDFAMVSKLRRIRAREWGIKIVENPLTLEELEMILKRNGRSLKDVGLENRLVQPNEHFFVKIPDSMALAAELPVGAAVLETGTSLESIVGKSVAEIRIILSSASPERLTQFSDEEIAFISYLIENGELELVNTSKVPLVVERVMSNATVIKLLPALKVAGYMAIALHGAIITYDMYQFIDDTFEHDATLEIASRASEDSFTYTSSVQRLIEGTRMHYLSLAEIISGRESYAFDPNLTPPQQIKLSRYDDEAVQLKQSLLPAVFCKNIDNESGSSLYIDTYTMDYLRPFLHNGDIVYVQDSFSLSNINSKVWKKDADLSFLNNYLDQIVVQSLDRSLLLLNLLAQDGQIAGYTFDSNGSVIVFYFMDEFGDDKLTFKYLTITGD